MIIDGKKIAGGILANLKTLPKPGKFLAAVLVGDDRSSVSFLGRKEKIARELGIDFRLYKFPVTVKNDELREEVGIIAGHKTCGGVIVQLPLPEHVNRHYVLNVISPEKDVDVLGERALGAFYAERSKILPPAVGATEEILKTLKPDLPLKSRSVAIVGLGLLVGRPAATWFMWRAKETFLLRSTSDLGILQLADLVITGAGKSGLLNAGMIKTGATVIDFGYDGGRGDFDPAGGAGNISYTPTPGGTGPVLVAKLFENFYKLNS